MLVSSFLPSIKPALGLHPMRCLYFCAGCDVNLANLEGDTPLWVACDKGLEEIVTSLLNVPGINLDAGFSHIPIHASALHGFTSIVEALLRAGCNVNKVSRCFVCPAPHPLFCSLSQVPLFAGSSQILVSQLYTWPWTLVECTLLVCW